MLWSSFSFPRSLPGCVRSCHSRWTRYGKLPLFRWRGVQIAGGRRAPRNLADDLESGSARGGFSPCRRHGRRLVGARCHRDRSTPCAACAAQAATARQDGRLRLRVRAACAEGREGRPQQRCPLHGSTLQRRQREEHPGSIVDQTRRAHRRRRPERDERPRLDQGAHRSGELHPRCGARHPRTQPARSVPAVPPPARVRGILQPTDDRSRGRTGMKEDILEQMVDEYLQHKGYFTRHNIKFRPAADHAEYDTRQDAVHSDIDVIGIHPRLDGARRVIVVSCKSWQSGFRPEYWIDAIAKNKVVSGREAWRGFRELTKEKWATAFRATLAERSGSAPFAYIAAVTEVIGSRSAWQDSGTLRVHLGGSPTELLTFSDMLKELFPFIDTTPASSQVGRVLQLIQAAGWSLDMSANLKRQSRRQSAIDDGSLLIPQQRRPRRQIKQGDVIRQRIVQDRGHDVRRQRGQVDHPAHVAVVDLLPRGDLLQ